MVAGASYFSEVDAEAVVRFREKSTEKYGGMYSGRFSARWLILRKKREHAVEEKRVCTFRMVFGEKYGVEKSRELALMEVFRAKGGRERKVRKQGETYGK